MSILYIAAGFLIVAIVLIGAIGWLADTMENVPEED